MRLVNIEKDSIKTKNKINNSFFSYFIQQLRLYKVF